MNINIFSKMKIDPNKYLLIKSPNVNTTGKVMKYYAKMFDEVGYIDKKVGNELESLFDDDYMVGIHRTGYSNVDDDYLNNVFSKGLVNNLDIMCGVVYTNEFVSIEKTVTLFYDFVMMNGQLKSADSYKNSEGCIIVKIPKSYLGKKEGEVKPIYYRDEEKTLRLLPEYVYGYVPCRNGVVGDIVHNDTYQDVHTYIDPEEELIYETEALKNINSHKEY